MRQEFQMPEESKCLHQSNAHPVYEETKKTGIRFTKLIMVICLIFETLGLKILRSLRLKGVFEG